MKKYTIEDEGVELYDVMYESPSEFYEDLKKEIKDEGFIRGSGKALLKYMSGAFYVIADNPEGSWEFIHYFNDNDTRYGINFVENAIMESPGVQGVRNRTKIAKEYIAEELEKKSDENDDEISMLDLGSGVGTYGYYALREQLDKNVKLTNLDIDDSAIEVLKFLKKGLGIKGKVDFIKGNAIEFLSDSPDAFDLIVSIGIVDYMEDEKSENFFYQVKDNLKEDGTFLTSVTDDYKFRSFSRLAGMSDLIPRSGEDLENMLEDTGYTEVEITTDDSKTQHIAKARS